MKIKPSFITNSSSAAFTIMKHNLTDIQIKLIYDHIEIAYAVCPSGKSKHGGRVHNINRPLYRGFHPYDSEWKISEDEEIISGFTSMDNFNMYWFLKEVVGVKEEDINYEGE
ncbi:MAG: hypothetical protein ACFFG0_01855 [Candidatus Thorarchaeota archaeon]